jgi:ABC-type uncharacterized transport system permease subunit
VAIELTSSLGSTLMGQGATAAIRANGTASVAIGASVILVTLAATVLGLRRITAASRRRRS